MTERTGQEHRVGRPELPVDPSDGPVAAFAAELRALRQEAGNPTYRALARRAGVSSSVLSEAARGRRMPTWTTVAAFVRGCGADPRPWQERWAAAVGHTETPKDEPKVAATATRSTPTSKHSRVITVRKPQRALVIAGGILIVAAALLMSTRFLHWPSPTSHRSAAAPRATTPTQGWARVIGPGCGRNVDGAQVDVDEGWGLSGNGWTGDGCDGQTRTTALSDSATWWNLTVGWTFEPYGNQAPATCELDVYVPNSPDATGTASYSIYGKDANGTPITPPIPVVQLSHRGTWVTLGTFDFPDGIVNLELYNVGRGTDHIVADAARAVCR